MVHFSTATRDTFTPPFTFLQTFNIGNTGTDVLNWHISVANNWLIINPCIDNTIEETDTIIVLVDRSNLEPGDYNGVISIISNGGEAEIDVFITVPADPTPAVYPSELDFGLDQAEIVLQIANCGKGVIFWSISSDCGWITYTPEFGRTIDEIDQVTVTINREGLNSGNYQTSAAILTSAGVVEVDISMDVLISPVLDVAPIDLSFGDDRYRLMLDISNSNNGVLNWHIPDDISWLDIDPGFGRITTETDYVSVIINRVGLAPGFYSGEFQVNSNAGMKTVSASLSVKSLRYSFFVAGHVYGKPGVDNVGVHPPFKDRFYIIQNDPNVELGVFTGDIVREPSEGDWDEIDADIELLGVPVYFAVGNHDLGDYGCERELFEQRYGSTYYSFMYKDDLFIILDPNPDGWNITGEQFVFLQYLMRTAGYANNVFVFFHQMLWWEPDNQFTGVPPNSRQGRIAPVNFWTEVEPLFHALDNNVYMFAGDIGAFSFWPSYMYYHYDNMHFIGSGMGGGNEDNFIVTEIDEGGSVSFRLIAINGDDENALGRLEDFVLPSGFSNNFLRAESFY